MTTDKNRRISPLLLLIVLLMLIIVGIIQKPWKTSLGEPVKKNAGLFTHAADDTLFQYSFIHAAELGAPAVVHIKSKVAFEARRFEVPDAFRELFDQEFWDRFFGIPQERPEQFMQASGSGVIIRDNGFIVTNNHVIDQAQEIEVVLHDGRSYLGEIVGADPLTDLALLKIEESQLSVLKFGDSDQTRVGEWVLAVGNPFYNLSSTVTAGIISAKARNINIFQDQAAIESFIQTDAAVNRGNSGGALMNIRGELIGINTAIASPTGVYAGYAFAIPSNVAAKVVQDLMKYGEVQRAQLGVFIRDLDSDMIKKMNLEQSKGVLVDSLVQQGAASEAGIIKGDIIVSLGEQPINNVAQLKAKISTYRPHAEVSVGIIRKGRRQQLLVKLKNM